MAFGSSPIATATAQTGINTSQATGTFDSTGADLLIVWIGYYNFDATISTVTDNKGNSFTACTPQIANTTTGVFYYSRPTTVGSGHTVTVTTTGLGIYAGVAVQAWAGSAASPLDQQNGASNIGASSMATGSITPTQNDELVVAGVACDNNSGVSATVNASMTVSAGPVYTAGTNEGAQTAYIVQTTAGAINPTWDITNVTKMCVAIASFKAAAGGGGATVKKLAALGVG